MHISLQWPLTQPALRQAAAATHILHSCTIARTAQVCCTRARPATLAQLRASAFSSADAKEASRMVCRRLRARPARYAGRTRMMSAPRCASGSRFNASNTARRDGNHMIMRTARRHKQTRLCHSVVSTVHHRRLCFSLHQMSKERHLSIATSSTAYGYYKKINAVGPTSIAMSTKQALFCCQMGERALSVKAIQDSLHDV